jgi:hypothetical protein
MHERAERRGGGDVTGPKGSGDKDTVAETWIVMAFFAARLKPLSQVVPSAL